jgi:hypothetical protein
MSKERHRGWHRQWKNPDARGDGGTPPIDDSDVGFGVLFAEDVEGRKPRQVRKIAGKILQRRREASGKPIKLKREVTRRIKVATDRVLADLADTASDRQGKLEARQQRLGKDFPAALRLAATAPRRRRRQALAGVLALATWDLVVAEYPDVRDFIAQGPDYELAMADVVRAYARKFLDRHVIPIPEMYG